MFNEIIRIFESLHATGGDILACLSLALLPPLRPEPGLALVDRGLRVKFDDTVVARDDAKDLGVSAHCGWDCDQATTLHVTEHACLGGGATRGA